MIKKTVLKAYYLYLFLTHLIGKLTKKYYFEDFLRVYPDNIVYYPFGIRKKVTSKDKINFLSHCRIYEFAGQFVKNKIVADIGCGSGYGCEILKKSGAKKAYGSDISKHALEFAEQRFGKIAKFSNQGITDLNLYQDNSFDIVVCTEVLEHIKEYGHEDKAVKELKRITKKNGLIIMSTPNTELLPEHGFSFLEIETLLKRNFLKYFIFENALEPISNAKILWKDRIKKHHTGIIVDQNLTNDEVAFNTGEKIIFKRGGMTGILKLGNYTIDTKLLKSAVSWIVVAQNNK